MFGDHFTDVATLSELSMETGGQVFYYPSFRANLHKSKLKNELIHDLTRVTGWEAVVRTRVSRGCKISNYRGSFKLKPNDLLVAPVIDSDKTVVGCVYV
jgi:protein transport protein SEC24